MEQFISPPDMYHRYFARACCTLAEHLLFLSRNVVAIAARNSIETHFDSARLNKSFALIPHIIAIETIYLNAYNFSWK